MRKVLLLLVLAGLALVAGLAVLSSARTRDDAAESRAERARLKREYEERAALARALPPEALTDWRDEVNALGRAYFQAVADVKNRYPHAPAAPTALAAAEAEKKPPSAKEREVLQDFQKYADGRLALLTGGAYAPLGSAVAGGLRLDVLSVEPGASPAGGPGLRIEFALWGVPRLVEKERTGERTVSRTSLGVALKHLELRFFDAGGKRFGEMASPGEPYQKLSDPERFSADFPPGILFGTWWMELLPREAGRIELALDADVRGAAGASRPVALSLALPVQEPWRIPPGATFQAETREAPPAGQ
jgi:hypothetical protein